MGHVHTVSNIVTMQGSEVDREEIVRLINSPDESFIQEIVLASNEVRKRIDTRRMEFNSPGLAQVLRAMDGYVRVVKASIDAIYCETRGFPSVWFVRPLAIRFPRVTFTLEFADVNQAGFHGQYKYRDGKLWNVVERDGDGDFQSSVIARFEDSAQTSETVS
jgi:hypothetical protein